MRQEQKLQAIESLDLNNVTRKLMEPAPEGKGWTLEQALEAGKWYRRFLQLCVLYPTKAVVPNLYIDTFWHQHILDTRAYAKDCQKIFGHFLHHYPYFGLNGDAQQRDDAFVETNCLYIGLFGEDCKTMETFKTAKAQGPTCVPEACSGGGTCSACTVDGRALAKAECGAACGGNEMVLINKEIQKLPAEMDPVMVGMQCGGGGSGTGCQQSCSRGR